MTGFAFRTLPARGELLATFTTVNDVHFGEEVCGVVDGSTSGRRSDPSPATSPYPIVMNRGRGRRDRGHRSGGGGGEGRPHVQRHAGGVRRIPRRCTARRSAIGCTTFGATTSRYNHAAFAAVADPGDRAARRAARAARHLARRRRRAAASPPISSTGSTRWPPTATGRCSCSATTTLWNPDSGERSDALLRHPSRRLRER